MRLLSIHLEPCPIGWIGDSGEGPDALVRAGVLRCGRTRQDWYAEIESGPGSKHPFLIEGPPAETPEAAVKAIEDVILGLAKGAVR